MSTLMRCALPETCNRMHYEISQPALVGAQPRFSSEARWAHIVDRQWVHVAAAPWLTAHRSVCAALCCSDGMFGPTCMRCFAGTGSRISGATWSNAQQAGRRHTTQGPPGMQGKPADPQQCTHACGERWATRIARRGVRRRMHWRLGMAYLVVCLTAIGALPCNGSCTLFDPGWGDSLLVTI